MFSLLCDIEDPMMLTMCNALKVVVAQVTANQTAKRLGMLSVMMPRPADVADFRWNAGHASRCLKCIQYLVPYIMLDRSAAEPIKECAGYQHQGQHKGSNSSKKRQHRLKEPHSYCQRCRRL